MAKSSETGGWEEDFGQTQSRPGGTKGFVDIPKSRQLAVGACGHTQMFGHTQICRWLVHGHTQISPVGHGHTQICPVGAPRLPT
jgi:hypothetical protein